MVRKNSKIFAEIKNKNQLFVIIVISLDLFSGLSDFASFLSDFIFFKTYGSTRLFTFSQQFNVKWHGVLFVTPGFSNESLLVGPK